MGHGNGVQIHDAKKVVVLLLPFDPGANGAQIVAEVQVAGGLHAGEDALFFGMGQGGGGRWSHGGMALNFKGSALYYVSV